MDPDTCLEKCRLLAASILNPDEDSLVPKEPSVIDKAFAGEELAEAFTNLDEWLIKGGFLPQAWAGMKPVR